MGFNAWFGIDRLLGLPVRPRPVEPPVPDVTALVLSGGGSRASFEIGALCYLYDRAGLKADVIAGTSAGAILGAYLAQYADHDEQARAIRVMDDLWADLKGPEELFAENLWYTKLRERTPEWQRMLQQRSWPRLRSLVPGLGNGHANEPSPTAASGASGPSAPSPATPTHLSPSEPVSPEGVPLIEQSLEVAQLNEASALAITPAVLEPTPVAGGEEAFEEAFDGLFEPETLDSSWWSPTLLLGVLSALPIIGRTGGDLPRILSGLERTRSMFRPGPLLRHLLDPDFFDEKRVRASGVRLRLAFVGLESGAVRYLTEDGTIVDGDDVPLPDAPEQRIEVGVLASCSIPGVFPPVHVGAEYCVDGGLRQSLPSRIVGRLGATRTYAVVASPLGLPLDATYRHRDLTAVVGRTARIMSDELLRSEVESATEAGAVVIIPELDVHDTLTVDPGLIAINRDYGWLRAAEAVLGLGPEHVARHRELIATRRDVWALEVELSAPGGPLADTGDQAPVPLGNGELTHLRTLKERIRELVDAMPDELVPEGAGMWWREYERHATPITVPVAWLGGDSPAGAPAASPEGQSAEVESPEVRAESA